jgi:hypothetical protein
MFGDQNGHIYISDRNLTISEESKHKLFNGPLLGVSSVFDYSNATKQYLVVIGIDGNLSDDKITLINTQLIVKVIVFTR